MSSSLSVSRILLLPLACALSLLPGCTPPGPGSDRPGSAGEVVFREEFNGPALDRSRWNVEGPDFWVNNEQQAYIDDPSVLPTYRVDRAAVERRGRWAFDNRKFLILNLALGGVYPRAVNGVDAPYPGSP